MNELHGTDSVYFLLKNGFSKMIFLKSCCLVLLLVFKNVLNVKVVYSKLCIGLPSPSTTLTHTH